MASEMIERIFAAEKQGETALSDANAKAKAIIDKAKLDATANEENVVSKAKLAAADTIKEAQEKAKAGIEDANRNAKKKAELLRKSVMSNVNAGINEIVNIIIPR